MPEQQILPPQNPVAEDEIDLLALAKTLWNGRKTVIYAVIAGAILGLIAAISSPKEYTASTVIVPQLGESQSRMGGLGGLAALAGISVDMSTTSELSPMVYPQIVSSTPFQLELMNTKLNFQGNPSAITLLDYYTKSEPSVIATIKKYTLGLPGVLIGAIRGKPKEITLISSADSVGQPILLTRDQVIVQKILQSLVSLEMNSKEGYITLTASMPEALPAAQLAQSAQTLLQRYITEFRIKKAKANLDFIQGRYNETKAEFEKAQVSLAIVSDRNKNFTSGLPRIEIDRIQTKYTIAFTVFQDLAKQLEQNKIQVKKETPSFAIVKPVTVPSGSSKPNRLMILFIWIFLGGVVGTGIVFGKGFLETIKKKWNEEK